VMCTNSEGHWGDVTYIKHRGISSEVINVVYRNKGILSEVVNVVYRNRGV
jgi:hypothetical protein